MKKNKLNDGHYLEAMDRLHLITENDGQFFDEPSRNSQK